MYALRTFVNVLDNSLSMSNLGRWKRMNGVPKISHRSLALLVLVRNGSNHEFSGLFLNDGKR